MKKITKMIVLLVFAIAVMGVNVKLSFAEDIDQETEKMTIEWDDNSEGVPLIDNDTIYIEYKGIDEHSTESWVMNYYIENRSNSEFYVKMNDTLVNGYMCSIANNSKSIEAGLKFLSAPSFAYVLDTEDLASYGIKEVENIECVLQVTTEWSGGDTICEIPVNIKVNKTVPEQDKEQFSTIKTLLDKEDLKVDYCGLYDYSDESKIINLYVENDRNDKVYMDLDDFVINGFSFSLANNYGPIVAHSKFLSEPNFRYVIDVEDFDTYGFSDIDTISFTLIIATDWAGDTIYSEPVTISLNDSATTDTEETKGAENIGAETDPANGETDPVKEPKEETASSQTDLQLGEAVTITTEKGTFNISIEGANLVENEHKDYSEKVVDLLCIIENQDYKTWDNKDDITLVPYGLSKTGIDKEVLVNVKDAEGFSLDFFDISPYSDGDYRSVDIASGSKARICMPYLAPANCTGITVDIYGDYSISLSFDDEGRGYVAGGIEQNADTTAAETNIENNEVSNETEKNADIETVKKVQEALNKAGYDCGVVDGDLGPTTREKIKEAQKFLDIEETGTITDELLENLSKLPDTATEKIDVADAEEITEVEKAFITATTITKSEMKEESKGRWSYDGVEFVSEDCDWLNSPLNKKGTINQGAFYRKQAYLLAGSMMGVPYEKAAERILGYIPETKEEWEAKYNDLSTYIVIEDCFTAIMKKFSQLGSVEGNFDFDNGKYSLTINDLDACAEELGITQEMLGWILADLEEYGISSEFNNKTYSLNM